MTTETKNKNTPVVKKVAKKRVAKKSRTTKTAKTKVSNHSHEFSFIAKNVGTAAVIMVALIIIISPENAWMTGPVVGSICIFGITAAYFADK